jgi:hypothetical protein
MQKRTASRRPSHSVPAVASEPEWQRLKETIRYEGLEDRVDVAGRFRVAVSLEKTKHLGAVHRHPEASGLSAQAKTFAKTFARLI